MTSTLWLVQRALLAVILMIAFYVLALAVALGLLLVPFLEWEVLGRLHVKIAAICIGAALALLWAIVPRPDHFEPPGPRLDEAAAPALFALVREVAAAAGQQPPSEIYLLDEANAWVTHRGGVMGVGSHRVMGIGLPIIQALSVAQLKAIIAHEFGHYSSGDVSIGPWIYKTRSAIARAICGVRQTVLQGIFEWYATYFLKLTHAVSRRQEFIADQLGAHIAGVDAMKSALTRVVLLAHEHTMYLRNDVAPVLRAGFLPPIAAGFDEYLRSAAMVNRAVPSALPAIPRGDGGFDTHPPLGERLLALESVPNSLSIHQDMTPASTLLPNLEDHGWSLTRLTLGDQEINRLSPLPWTSVGKKVYAEAWRSKAASHSDWLCGFRADALPSSQAALIRAGSDLVGRSEMNINSEERIDRAVQLLGAGIGVGLLDRGWGVRARAGRPVVVERGADVIDPLETVRRFAADEVDRSAWKARCVELGLSGAPLGQSIPAGL